MKISRSIFLFDGIGAIFSFSLMFFMVAGLPEYFGLSPNVAYGLAVFPVLYGIYSFYCHFLQKSDKQFFTLLRGIIVANLCYCFLTLLVLFYFFPNGDQSGRLTNLGVGYLVLEILVIIGVVFFEFLVLRSLKKNK